MQRSVSLYRDLLGCTLRAVWADGAYLEAGSLLLCVSRDDLACLCPHPDYTHIALSIAESDYPALSERVSAECEIWKDKRSEGSSTCFLDPDGHKLGIHLGDLATRLAHYRQHRPEGMWICD